MCDPLSHGLLASAGVARASSAMMGSGNPAFTHDLHAPVSRGKESSRTPPLVGSQLQAQKGLTV